MAIGQLIRFGFRFCVADLNSGKLCHVKTSVQKVATIRMGIRLPIACTLFSKAYVADGDAGLLIIDISDPTASYIIGVVDVSGNIGGVTLSSDGSKAYVSDYLSGLKIIDLTGLK